MASNPNTLFVTFVDVDRNLLKIWGQKNRIGASYIERQLSHLATEFNRTPSLNPSRIRKGMLCYAKHSDDYYRARVISNVQGDSVGVLFVDFGNRNLVHVSNIKIRESSEDVLLKMAEQAEEYYLARVIAPAGGWAKEIISEIRHAICYEELVCNEIFQVGDQKLLEIQFQSEDFSSFLIKKQFAQEVPLNIQSHMILSYCSLVPSNPKQNSSLEEMLKTNFSVPPQHLGRPISSKSSVQDNPAKDLQKQCNFPKISNPTNFSQTSLSNYHSSGQTNPSVHNANKTSPSDAYYNSMRSSFMNENPVQTTKPPFNSLLYNQYNPVFQMKGKPEQLLDCYNNAMIAALAQQIKQYIAEGNAKSSEEKIPHNYVNSVSKIKF